MPTVEPVIIRESYLAAAEPSWANRITDWQLLGVLNLSALMTPQVFLSDVHLGDNVHIFASYTKSRRSGLYEQITSLAKAAVICPMLRDRTVRPQHSDAEAKVDCFEDVFRSWKAFDADNAWINQDRSGARAEFFRSLDRDLGGIPLKRYDYAAVKAKFMEDTRTAAGPNGARWFADALKKLSKEKRRQYDDILRRNWFSLSDIYNFLQTTGTDDVGLSALLAHGLLNEGAYSSTVGCNLTGYDTEDAFVQEKIWRPDPVLSSCVVRKPSHEAIAEQAATVLDSPSLSLLSFLKAPEILAIRELGKPYFEFAEHTSRTRQFADETQFQKEFIYHATTYWSRICDFIAQAHRGGAKRPRKIALFFNQLPAPLSRISEDTFRFALSLGGETMLTGDSMLKAAITRLVQFVFLTDTEEMRTLRGILPLGVWSRENPDPLEVEGQLPRH